MNDDLFYKLLILRTPKIGPMKYAELVRRFGDVRTAADALGADAARMDAVRREMDRANALGVRFVCDTDADYPARLRAVRNHPPVLCVRGNMDALRRSMVAVVGTRHATAAGMGFVAELSRAFAERGVAVVSGMAMGTDTAAHRGALGAAGDAQTVAVLAGGVDYIWPQENEALYWDIVARGAVVSEMPVGFVPVATNFVQRNRWVAGLCDKLVLGEADLKSGSMATARFAMEYGRDVWAVPSHPSDSRAAGPNSLIRSGAARLCSGADDFFAPTGGLKSDGRAKKEPDENALLDKIGAVPVSESVLAEIAEKSVSEIKRDLIVLELQGLIQKVGGGYVRM